MVERPRLDKPVLSLRPFIDVKSAPLSEEDIRLVENAKENITKGVAKFREALGRGLTSRTAEEYAAVYDSAASFAAARFNLLALVRRNPRDPSVRSATLKAIERVDKMEDMAVRLERLKRPGDSAARQALDESSIIPK